MKLIKLFTSVAVASVVAFSSVFFAGCGTKITLIDGEDRLTESVSGTFTLPVPERVGYRFLGWFDSADSGIAYTDGEGAGLSAWTDGNPTTLYAQWELKEYTFLFDATLGELDVDGETVLSYLSNVDTFPVPTRSGYVFGGWLNGDGEPVCDGFGNPLSDCRQFTAESYPVNDENGTVSLTAQWLEKRVTYTFQVNGGTAVTEVSGGLGEVIDLPATAKDGYSFVGWSRSSGAQDLVSSPYTVPSTDQDNTTFYAFFQPATVAGVTFTAINNDTEYSVAYNGTEENVYIPEIYNGKFVTKVTKISTSVKTLYLPHTAVSISEGAMQNCTKLETLRLPYSLTSIPNNLLKGCSALSEVMIPQTVTSIGDSAFEGTKIKTFAIPATVRSIGDSALRSTEVEGISVAAENNNYVSVDGVLYEKQGTVYNLVQYPALKEGDSYTPDARTVSILEKAFYGVGRKNGQTVDGGLKELHLGGKISTVGDDAFASSSLVRVEIDYAGASVSPRFGNRVFQDCLDLRMVRITLNQPPQLGNNAFYGTSTYVYVPTAAYNSYRSASGWSAYSSKIRQSQNIMNDFAYESYGTGVRLIQYLGYAEEVEIPEYINGLLVLSIGEMAFYGSTTLKSVSLPSGVQNIGNSAFASCTFLQSLTCKAETPPTLGTNCFSGVTAMNIYVPAGESTVDAYRNATGWSYYSSNIFTIS
ncbi:MAG: leucine-rich repeat protein [Clostridia bacterium]|nr:leucine-rich repeat protein [Clostridia bacterium]